MRRQIGVLLLSLLSLTAADSSVNNALMVHYAEGLTHGFLTLTTLDGVRVADGELIQTVRGTRVTSRLIFHFDDGSLYDDTTVFSQRERFQLVTDHLIQKGASFPQAIEMFVDAVSKRVEVRYTDDGRQKVAAEQMSLPSDVANGMMLSILKNLRSPPAELSLVVATPKPRLVKLKVTQCGEQPFVTGKTARRATCYTVSMELGGLTGVIAPLVGKQPPDSRVWILRGDAPAFIRSELPLFNGGPVWRIDLASPVWRSQRTDN